MRATFFIGALLSIFTVAQAADIGEQSGADFDKLKAIINDDPEDSERRFSFPRNAHPQDFPLGDARYDENNKTSLRLQLPRILKDIKTRYPDKEDPMRKKLEALVLRSHADMVGDIAPDAGLTCSDENYQLAKQAFDSAVFMADNARGGVDNSNRLFKQLFGADLPAAKAGQTGDVNTIRSAYDKVANLENLSTAGFSSEVDPVTFACHTKKDAQCTFAVIAFVVKDTNIVHFCPPFFSSDKGTADVPRNIAESKTKTPNLCTASPGKLMSYTSATVLHELTHAAFMGDSATDDHAYDVRKIAEIIKLGYNYPWWSKAAEDKLKKGNILALTPKQAEENADTYSWFALLRLREQFCGIPIVSKRETWRCYSIPSKYWDFEYIIQKGKHFFSATKPCEDSCETSATPDNRNTKRQTQTGQTCCPRDQTPFETTDPKTKQKTTSCKCKQGFKQVGTGDKIKCLCPAKTIKSKDATCIKCPVGQVPNAAQTACVKDDGKQNPQDDEKEKKKAELEAKKKELEDKKAENGKKVEERKNAVKEEAKKKNTPGTPENDREKEEREKKCPKGVAGIVCRAGNAVE